MKNRLKFILLCLLIALVSLFAACKKAEEEAEKPVYEVYGFNVVAEVDVEYGQSYSIVRPSITDSYGNSIDVTFVVTDSYGKEVKTVMQSFFAVDGKGYTITFTAVDYEDVTHTATTKVNVLNAKDLGVASKKVFDNDETVEIVPVTTLETPTYTYSVRCGDAAIEVTETEDGATFIPVENGLYDVCVTASEGARSFDYDYQILVREPTRFGEVETFDENWAVARTLNGYGTYGWEVTNTEQSGIVDRFGESANFLTITVNATDNITAPRFYLNPRNDLSYYEELAAEGYDTISVWLYTEASERKVHLYRSASRTSGNMRNPATLIPGEWVEARIPVLNTASNASAGNLQDHYDTWQSRLVWLLSVNNSAKTFPLTVYIADIYVTKSVETTATEPTETYKVGDSVDASAFFDYDTETYEAKYTLTDEYGQKRYVSDGESLQFSHNGTYQLALGLCGNNYRTDAKVTLTVDDDVVRTGDAVSIVERTATNATFDLKELCGTLTYNGNTLTPNGYTVEYKDGTETTVADGAFTATKDGWYACLVSANYQAFGITCTTYQAFTVDVYTEENKYAFIDTSSTDSLNAQIFHTKTIVGETELAELGLEGDFYRVTASQSGDAVGWARLGLDLVHSHAYYERVLEGDWRISFDVYLKPEDVDDDSVGYDIRFLQDQAATTYSSNQLIHITAGVEYFFYDDPYVGDRLMLILRSTGGVSKHYAYVGNITFEQVQKTDMEGAQSDFFGNIQQQD